MEGMALGLELSKVVIRIGDHSLQKIAKELFLFLQELVLIIVDIFPAILNS